MPRYLIERTYTVDMEASRPSRRAPRRSATTTIPRSSGSTVTSSSATDGTPKSFCIYDAPNEEMVREHASGSATMRSSTIYEIAGDVTPDDFPLIEDPG